MTNLQMQKCLHLEDAKKIKSFKLDSPYAVMCKLDGWYLTLDYFDGRWGKLTSSSGREVPSLSEISQILTLTKGIKGYWRFIFEGVIPGIEFYEANGRFNRKNEQVLDVVLNLHDVISLENPSNTPFNLRYNEFVLPFGSIFKDKNTNLIEIVPILNQTIYEDVLYKHFNEIVQAGGEGIVAKKLSACYSPGKRNKDMLKLKEEVTKDLLVVGIEVGIGKYHNMVGSLICKNKAGSLTKVSGMTDSQREEWWDNPTRIVGKVVEVKAMKELPNGVLYQPRFKQIRFDKTINQID